MGLIGSIMLFGWSMAWAGGRNALYEPPAPDSLEAVWHYTEGLKKLHIEADTSASVALMERAVEEDSTYAPAYFQLSKIRQQSVPTKAIEWAHKAWLLDSTNIWYEKGYAQALIFAGRYKDATSVYRNICRRQAGDPDNYRLLAALYEQVGNPYMAINTLDSAELHFGRIPYLSKYKQRLLVETNQMERAIDEAQEAVRRDPLDGESHTQLAALYGINRQDSLARASYHEALKIDSTSLETLMSLGAFYSDRHDYIGLLQNTKRIFWLEDMPLDEKLKHLEPFTSDRKFYGQFFYQINELVTTLAILYPKDPRVVGLFAGHQIAAGEIEGALATYKNHLNDEPQQEEYFHAVIEIEHHLQRADSVQHYLSEALAKFPRSTSLHLLKGNLKYQAQRYHEAIEAYRSSLSYASSDSLRSIIWGQIGDTYQTISKQENPDVELAPKSKWMKLCYKAYDRSLEYDTNNISVMNNYAYFLSLEGRALGRALDMAGRVVAATNNNPTYMDTYAWVLFRLGRTAEAKKVMQQAIAWDGYSSHSLLLHYGDILYDLGEYFLAETYWKRALEKGANAQEITTRFEKEKKRKAQKQ